MVGGFVLVGWVSARAAAFILGSCREGREGGFEDPAGFRPSENGFDDDPGLQSERPDGKSGEEPVFGGDVFLEFHAHRDAGKHEHEGGGWDDEPDGEIATPEPKGDDEKGEAGEELISCPKEGPEEKAAFSGRGEAPFSSCTGERGYRASDQDREDGGGMFVGHPSERVIGFPLGLRARFGKENGSEFLRDVALESAGGVQGGGGKGRHKDTHHGNGKVWADAECFEEICRAIDKGTYFRPQAFRAVPTLVA